MGPGVGEINKVTDGGEKQEHFYTSFYGEKKYGRRR